MLKVPKPPAKLKFNGKIYDLKFSERTVVLANRTTNRLRNQGAHVRIKQYGKIYYLYVRNLLKTNPKNKDKLIIKKLKNSPKGHKNLKYVVYINGKHQGFAETKEEAKSVGSALLSASVERLRRFNALRKHKRDRFRALRKGEL